MDKYDQLALKLEKALNVLDALKSSNHATNEFLNSYREYTKAIRIKAINKELPATDGALMGLLRWLSDYDELADNDELWREISEIEKFHLENF